MTKILFIPGIKGSELYEDQNKRWFPKNTEDLPSLDIDNPLTPGAPIRKISAFVAFRTNIYKGVLDSFSPEEFEYFTYDWRQDIRSHVDSLVRTLVRMTQGEGAQVTVVAHSMGGMLAKLALLALNEMKLSVRVNKLITIGTPWRGAPDSFKVLAYGEPGFYHEFSEIKEAYDDKKTMSLARQYPSVYQLLPSHSYFTSEDGNCLIDSDDPEKELDYSDLTQKVQIFFNEENSKRPVPKNVNVYTAYMQPIHQSMLAPLPDGIEHECIIGINYPTLYRVPVSAPKERKKFKSASKFKNGDGVVPIMSATPPHSSNVYFVKGEHKNLCSEDAVIDFIKWVVNEKKDQLPRGVILTEPDNVKELKQGALGKFLCPIDSTILDTKGRYIAGAFDTDIEELSPLATSQSIFYYTVGEAKYLYFKEDSLEDLNVVINSYDTGVADISFEVYEEDGITDIHFAPLPVDKGSSATAFIPLQSKEDAILDTGTYVDKATIIKRKRTDEEAKFPIPSLKIIITAEEGTRKIPHNPIYSGPVKLSIKTEMDKMSSLYYSIDGDTPVPYVEEELLSLKPGQHTIQTFGKDIIGRPTRTKSSTLHIDTARPETKIHVTMNPEGLNFHFTVKTTGSNGITHYRVLDDQGRQVSVHETEMASVIDKNEVHVPINHLQINKGNWYEIEYYSVNAFGIEEDLKKLRISVGDITVLMWGEQSTFVTPEMVWQNVLTHNSLTLDTFDVLLFGKGLIQTTYSSKIGDDIKGVRFDSEKYTIDVMYAEKYSLYFVGLTEVLEIGRDYKFYFELLSERTREKVTNTNPEVWLQQIKGNKTKLDVTEKNGTYYSGFTVDNSFNDFKYKLVIIDAKNTHPALREISLISKQESKE
jgi:pimeloyl-ACP methyl ester carboxylesterase